MNNMDKYFINKQEVEQEEFYAEFVAQSKAHIDENFFNYLVEYGDNADEFFFVGGYAFTVKDIYNMLDDSAQRNIYNTICDFYLEVFRDELKFHDYCYILEDLLFAIEESE
jgi:hypothetical protein